jgi:protein-export membrane protein SecD
VDVLQGEPGVLSLRGVDRTARERAEGIARALLADTIEWRTCPPTAGPGEVCFQLTVAQRAKLKQAALGDAVATIRKRIDQKGESVVPKGDKIVVELPTLDAAHLEEVRAAISRVGRLEFVVVDESSPYMQRLYQQVGAERDGSATDPAAKALGIMADIDFWRDDAGTRRIDPYLVAYDRSERVSDAVARKVGCPRAEVCALTGQHVIQRYLEDLARRDPSFKVPSDRRIVFERVTPQPGAKDQRPYARTYFVHMHPALTGSSVADARATLDASTNQTVVQLDFDRAGAVAFGEVTGKIVGKKLATLLDGTVRSAPVIMSGIRGGRVSISLGGRDATAAHRDAEELARVLRAGALPVPVRETQRSDVVR